MEFTEEQILLRALSRGDEKAFEVLFMRYFPRVKRFISGLLQDDITAEDFAQDILLKLWQKREEMAKIENLNAYLYRTSRNAVYQHLRHILLVNDMEKSNRRIFPVSRMRMRKTLRKICLPKNYCC